MRCLAIAKTMQKIEENVCFLTADDNSSKVLTEAGIKHVVLHSDWSNLMTDVDAVKILLQKEDKPLLLIDTYKITKDYVEALKPYCKIAYLGSKLEYLGQLDFLINYSTDIDYQFYQNHYDEKTLLLLGPSFAPLRDEFQNIERSYKSRIERVLLTTGNTNKDQMVDSILKKILPVIQENDIIIDVVIGRMFEDKLRLCEKYDRLPNVVLHENVQSMSTLMRNCDLAISANGTTVYELSAIGLPTISFAMVEEQVRSAEVLSSLGAINYCGRSYSNKNECINSIVKRVKYYMVHNEELINLAKTAHNLIDGNGCQKIVEALMSGF